MKLFAFFLVLVATMLPVDAFWRMDCHSPVGVARIDPLVSLNTVSAHAHTIHGSSAFSPSTINTDQLIAGDCTSCLVTQDKSVYWTPACYFKDTSGKFTLVRQVGGMLAYYLLQPNAGDTKVTAFPKDFRMIAGDVNQRNFTLPVPDPDKSSWYKDPAQSSQAGLRQKAIGFNCLNYAAAPEGTLYRHFLPDKAFLDANCPDGIRAELQFPSCWNGKDSDSSDHKSHMAYPDLVMTGTCPDGFPVRVVTMLYETIWATGDFKGKDGTFVFGNGDPTGYGYHGDFIMGWEETFLQSAVDTCTNPSGLIQDCPLFNIQTQAQGAQCLLESLPAEIKSEDVIGPISSLPGKQIIYPGPEYAIGAEPVGTAASVAAPSLPYSAGIPMVSSAIYVPGGVFNAVPTPVASPTAAGLPIAVENVAVSPVVTTAPAPTTQALKDNQKIFSTTYRTAGNAVVELVMVEELVTVTDELFTTVTVTAPNRKRHNHFHRHARRN